MTWTDIAKLLAVILVTLGAAWLLCDWWVKRRRMNGRNNSGRK